MFLVEYCDLDALSANLCNDVFDEYLEVRVGSDAPLVDGTVGCMCYALTSNGVQKQ